MTYNKIVSEPTSLRKITTGFSMDAGLRVELETMLPSSLEKEEYQDCLHAILIFWSLRVKAAAQLYLPNPIPAHRLPWRIEIGTSA